MKTSFTFAVALLLAAVSGFAQTTFSATAKEDCGGVFIVQPSIFDTVRPVEMPVTSIETLGKIAVCPSPYKTSFGLSYTPTVYDWAQAAQRIEDYRIFQYQGHPQDINGRDLLLNVITNEMLNGILHRTFPN